MRNLLSGLVSGAGLVVLWAVLTHKPPGRITIAEESEVVGTVNGSVYVTTDGNWHEMYR